MPADQIEIAANGQAPHLARAFAAHQLEAWHIDPPYFGVLLAASELVTNAVMHGREPIVVRLAVLGRCVRLEIGDTGSETPVVRTPGRNGGFGLHLIEGVCERWGVTTSSNGKVVWCEFALPLTGHFSRPAGMPGAWRGSNAAG
jgi:anti-sigma regulatory factor (Ser/Thr protein kinase)